MFHSVSGSPSLRKTRMAEHIEDAEATLRVVSVNFCN
jgi:hypothetical protein